MEGFDGAVPPLRLLLERGQHDAIQISFQPITQFGRIAFADLADTLGSDRFLSIQLADARSVVSTTAFGLSGSTSAITRAIS